MSTSSVEIPEAVRRLALHPMRELPESPWYTKVQGRHVLAGLAPPLVQGIEPGDLGPDDVEAAVEEAREIVRAHGRSSLYWCVAPEHGWLGPPLEQLGLEHRGPPGAE